MLAVTIVAIISLITKVASIEVARQASGDLDREFRAHGIASLIAAPVGGLISSLQIGTSRLLEQAGGDNTGERDRVCVGARRRRQSRVLICPG